MEQTITKSKTRGGTFTLPPSIGKSWQDREILIIPEKNRLVIQPFDTEEKWAVYETKMRRGGKKISTRIIDEAIGFARRKNR